MPTRYPVTALLTLVALAPGWLLAADSPPLQAHPGQHADQAFQDLSQHERNASQVQTGPHRTGMTPSAYSSDEYLQGIGEGDLSKGRLTCQRVAELAARTDLAKQIRVHVTEHATDRVRERSGRTTEQDIEVVREEMVNELLRDVRIIDKRTDEAAGTCSSIAVMPRSRIVSDRLPETSEQSTPPNTSAR